MQLLKNEDNFAQIKSIFSIISNFEPSGIFEIISLSKKSKSLSSFFISSSSFSLNSINNFFTSPSSFINLLNGKASKNSFEIIQPISALKFIFNMSSSFTLSIFK